MPFSGPQNGPESRADGTEVTLPTYDNAQRHYDNEQRRTAVYPNIQKAWLAHHNAYANQTSMTIAFFFNSLFEFKNLQGLISHAGNR